MSFATEGFSAMMSAFGLSPAVAFELLFFVVALVATRFA
jgi:hypothetical protein